MTGDRTGRKTGRRFGSKGGVVRETQVIRKGVNRVPSKEESETQDESVQWRNLCRRVGRIVFTLGVR